MAQPAAPAPSPSARRRLVPLAVALALAAVAVAGAIVWFLRDDAPDEVSLDAAAAALGDASTTVSAGPTTAPAGTAAGVTSAATVATPSTSASGGAQSAVVGTWAVDTSIGNFDFENSTGSFAGFRVKEELSSIGSTTAVGRTPAVSGTLVIAPGSVTQVEIRADLTKLVTNDSRRDSRARGALATGQFPTATFALRSPIALPSDLAEGKDVSVAAAGDLTIKGVTRPVTFPLQARLTGDTIVVVGSLDVVFADYGVQVPSAPVVLSAEDHGPIELQLFFRKA